MEKIKKDTVFILDFDGVLFDTSLESSKTKLFSTTLSAPDLSSIVASDRFFTPPPALTGTKHSLVICLTASINSDISLFSLETSKIISSSIENAIEEKL